MGFFDEAPIEEKLKRVSCFATMTKALEFVMANFEDEHEILEVQINRIEVMKPIESVSEVFEPDEWLVGYEVAVTRMTETPKNPDTKSEE